MEDIFNQIKAFITFELDPIVRWLIVGLLLIFGLFSFSSVVKEYVNAKSYASVKIGPIIFTTIYIGLAIFIAAV